MWRKLPLSSIIAVGLLALASLAAGVAFSSSAGTGAPGATPAETNSPQKVAAAYAKLPLRFEATGGQGRYAARGPGYGVFLSGGEARLSLANPKGDPALVRMRLLGGNPRAAGAVLGRQPGTSNYLTGNDKRAWRTGVPGYAKVRFRSVYPGTDIVYYGRQGRLEYDFVVAPGADPKAIALAFTGADKLRLDARGDLILTTPAGRMRQQRPVVYQRVNGERRPVSGRYVVRGKHVGFRLGAYDRTRPLVIDPILSYSTYFGGTPNHQESAADVAVDRSGSAYITGGTATPDFPTTEGAYDRDCADCVNASTDAFVTKLSPAGALVYSTYLGGGNSDNASGIAVGPTCASSCSAYVAGTTRSADFPATGGVQTARKGAVDGFFAKLNAAGSALEYSTYFGGTKASDFETDRIAAVKTDPSGNAYITGATESLDLPTTRGRVRPRLRDGHPARRELPGRRRLRRQARPDQDGPGVIGLLHLPGWRFGGLRQRRSGRLVRQRVRHGPHRFGRPAHHQRRLQGRPPGRRRLLRHQARSGRIDARLLDLLRRDPDRRDRGHRRRRREKGLRDRLHHFDRLPRDRGRLPDRQTRARRRVRGQARPGRRRRVVAGLLDPPRP